MPKKHEVPHIVLRAGNINFVASQTGIPIGHLELMLEKAKERNEYEVRVPLGVTTFTRKE